MLDQVEILIKKSPFYRPNLKLKIFLRSDVNKYNLLPFQFSELGYGQTVQTLSNNIYIADRKYKAAFFDSAPLSNPKPAFKIPKNWPYWKQGYMKTRLACG